MSEGKGFLHDERGNRSTARALLWIVVLYTLALIYQDARLGDLFEVPGEAYVLLGTIMTGLTLWAGGARFAQHAAPAFAGMVSAIGSAAAARKNARRDAELGIEETK